MGELHHIVEHLADQVQTLVGYQTADNGHNGRMGLLPQACHPLELSLALILAGHILGREGLLICPSVLGS